MDIWNPPRGSLGAWIAMKDRPPDFRLPVIFYGARFEWVGVGDWRQDGHFWTDHAKVSREGEITGTVPSEYVTHWQPLVLPELSEEEHERIRQMAARGEDDSTKEGA